MENLTLEEAENFFSEFYCGKHNIPGKVHVFGDGFRVKHNLGALPTYDSNKLTRLVLMAHDKCIRVSISPLSFNYLSIEIWKRSSRNGAFYERHPTIETAISNYRSIEP